MADEGQSPLNRPLGATEHNWCRAVDTGTGITVLGFLFNKSVELQELQAALEIVLWRHPRLRSRIVWIEQDKTSFRVDSGSGVEIEEVVHDEHEEELGDWLALVEEEMNFNPWVEHERAMPVMFARLHRMPKNSRSLFVIRFHTAACDRTAAALVMSEVMHCLKKSKNKKDESCKDHEGDEEIFHEAEAGSEKVEDDDEECVDKVEQLVAVEDAIPKGQANKPFWAHGVDLLGYSLGSLRHALLPFENAEAPRKSQLIRAVLGEEQTQILLKRSQEEQATLFGVLAAGGLKATTICKQLGQRFEHYALIGLVDCRKHIDLLAPSTTGFYHSAILNTHQVSESGTEFWDLARRCSESLLTSIKNRKHFTDMGDINYLMFQALQRPNLTPCSSLRTSLMVLFEDAIEDVSEQEARRDHLGLEDYVGCASIHGVGPSMALFHSFRDGALHLNLVFPAPLHSRPQVQLVLDTMVDCMVNESNN